jgi:putative membrane protein
VSEPPIQQSSLPPGLLRGEPQRLHPTSPVLDLVLSARQWAFPLAILILGSGWSFALGPLSIMLLATVVGWKVLAWTKFTYRLHGDVLTVEHGILQRQRREVPISRIQQVDLRRRLRHRVLGVATVRIDTAGGGSGAEVVLEAIADQQAHDLRAALLARAAVLGAPVDPADAGVPAGAPPTGDVPSGAALPGLGPPSPPPANRVPVVQLGTAELLVAGVTGSRLAALVPLVGAAYGLLFQLPASASEEIIDRVPTGTSWIVFAAVALVPVLLVAAAGSSVLTDHGFTLVRVGPDLHLRRGLVDQREATLSVHRIQVVRIQENLVRRALGLAQVQLQSAGSGTDSEGAVTRVTIPCLRVDALPAFLASVNPELADCPELIGAPGAARRRSWLRRFAFPAVLLVGLVLAWRELAGTNLTLAGLVLSVPLGLGAELNYRNLGHVGTPVLVAARGGGFVRETALVPVAKAQSTRLRSSPFQRRAGLATLFIDVAGVGSTPAVVDGDARRLSRLRVETVNTPVARHDEGAVRRRLRGVTQPPATHRPPDPAARSGGPPPWRGVDHGGG